MAGKLRAEDEHYGVRGGQGRAAEELLDTLVFVAIAILVGVAGFIIGITFAVWDAT